MLTASNMTEEVIKLTESMEVSLDRALPVLSLCLLSLKISVFLIEGAFDFLHLFGWLAIAKRFRKSSFSEPQN
ncbi:hypothetical protein JW960_21455 [candidate division KSB1 bacterium]|nr:hypothetical protein [candidate division KSB1 bacterium]